MPRVVLMCGPAGSGKSTVARRLEAAGGMTRLSYDQEAWNRGLRAMPLPHDADNELDAHLRQHLIRLLDQGRDVVLDFSFWSRAMRDDWRRLVARYGITAETIYMATDKETCMDRIRARVLTHGDDFPLEPDVAAHYFNHFQPPTEEEGPLTVHR
ncbi:AAA family ATPase [Ornithinimicrobium pratense]|uniref:ATP-binding protein n=1 Tax=Ornithinimicrobium pratense TaxID=2593973 RepID=A0A5J6V3Q5_9MICO|nr:ATP-binding protein [Ornithinimicrobium pratense]QFG67916.1 ATP-binding protein [Ornithinimicrobium pratense]